MKLLCSILCIYVFTLFAYPCQDGDEICNEPQNTENSSQDNHHHDENNCHTCSPFCFCNCCQGTTLVTVNSILEAIDTPTEIQKSSIKVISVKEITLTIWQPPKV